MISVSGCANWNPSSMTRSHNEIFPLPRARSGAIRNLFGVECLCLGLERLIHVKRAAGRPKDFEAIAELEAILEERQQG